MPAPLKAISVRVPEGMPEELRALTGVHFSTLVRSILSIYLQRERAARIGKPAAVTEAHDSLSSIIDEVGDDIIQQAKESDDAN